MRERQLVRARDCAAISLPHVLPPKNFVDGNPISQPYQSIGSVAVMAFVGRMMSELYPADRPHFEQDLAPKVLFDPTISDEAKRALRDALHVEDMTVMLLLETAGNVGNGPSGMGFHAAKQRSLTQLAVTGDTCERLNPDFSLTVFRRDAYVVQRDGEQRLVKVITVEDIDPLSLSDDKLSKLELTRAELEEVPASTRVKKLYTRCSWDYGKKKWRLCQEIDRKEIYEAWKDRSPLTVTALALANNDSYGRGIIELAYGDLYSYNALSQCMLDYAGMSSKLVPCIDENSNTKPEDLAKPSGEPIYTKVKDGLVKDVAFLQVNKGNDMAVVEMFMQRLAERLGRVLMLNSESVRNSERTTAFEVQSVTLQQQQEAMSALFASVADQMDAPQVAYAIDQAREKGLLPKLSEESRKGVRVTLLTGQTALAAQARAARALALPNLAAKLGEAASKYIDPGVMFRMFARMHRFDEPGLIKSEKQVAAETHAAIQQQLQLAAGQQAVQSAGAIAEQVAAATQPKG